MQASCPAIEPKDLATRSGKTRPLAADGTAAPPTSEDRRAEQGRRRARRRFRHEILVRTSVAVVILVFNEVFGPGSSYGATRFIRHATLGGLLFNGLYYAVFLTGVRLRLQAYVRMLLDIGFLTVGLYSVGGLVAAPFLGVYVIVPLYAGLMFSTASCMVASSVATTAFLAMALLQYRGVLPLPAPPPPDVWVIVAFNLIVLNLVGALTAMLAEAYRQSRLRLAAAYEELERAHDASMRLADEIQRGARLYALGEVVAGVTHEIGNVLQAVAGHAELARRRITEGTADAARHLEQVTHGCESAMRIVHNVLEVGRQAPAEVTAVSVVEIANSIAQLKGYELRRDRIELRLDFAADFPRVNAAPYQVQQVLLNLVKNAQEALQQSPVRIIEIVGRAEGGAAVVIVCDTGPGIPAPVVPRLFEPFYTTKPSGTGLGLAISAGIVRSLGGDLSAENRREGGAAFRVTLPAAASSTPSSVPPSLPSAVSLGA